LLDIPEATSVSGFFPVMFVVRCGEGR